MSFANLPDDVIFLVWEYCTFGDFFAFSAVNKALYQTSRSFPVTILCRIAYNTFHPRAPRILCNDPKNFSSHSCESLTRHYVYQYLATVLVDRKRLHRKFYRPSGPETLGTCAADPLADELRNRIAEGWRILDLLSDLLTLHQRELDDQNNTKAKIKSVFESKARRLELRRDGSSEWWTSELAARVSSQQVQDFILLWQCLCSAVVMCQHFGQDGRIIGAKIASGMLQFDWAQYGLGRASWIDWAILSGGSRLFYSQWRGCLDETHPRDEMRPWLDINSPTYPSLVRDHIMQLWRRSKRRQIERETAAVAALMRSLRTLDRDAKNGSSGIGTYTDAFMKTEPFSKKDNPETMARVPFWIPIPCRDHRDCKG